MLGKIGDEDPDKNQTTSRLAIFFSQDEMRTVIHRQHKVEGAWRGQLLAMGAQAIHIFDIRISDQKTMHAGPEQQQIRNIRYKIKSAPIHLCQMRSLRVAKMTTKMRGFFRGLSLI